jgi:hypothetical protein
VLCIFQNNKYLKDLNLSHNMFGEEGGEILGAAIGRNRNVSSFTIHNMFGEEGGEILGAAIGRNRNVSSFTIHVLYFLIFNWYLNIFSIEMFVLLCGYVITTFTEFI